jgi:hypothetical protein
MNATPDAARLSMRPARSVRPYPGAAKGLISGRHARRSARRIVAFGGHLRHLWSIWALPGQATILPASAQPVVCGDQTVPETLRWRRSSVCLPAMHEDDLPERVRPHLGVRAPSVMSLSTGGVRAGDVQAAPGRSLARRPVIATPILRALGSAAAECAILRRGAVRRS